MTIATLCRLCQQTKNRRSIRPKIQKLEKDRQVPRDLRLQQTHMPRDLVLCLGARWSNCTMWYKSVLQQGYLLFHLGIASIPHDCVKTR
jgi:hypothetical protein